MTNGAAVANTNRDVRSEPASSLTVSAPSGRDDFLRNQRSALSAQDTKLVNDIIDRVDTGTATALRELVAKDASALLSKGSDGKMLLEHLHALAIQQNSGAAPTALNTHPTALNTQLYRSSDLLNHLINAAIEPGRTVTQEDKTTCTVTSIQARLCRSNPAEYARLMVGLTSNQGQVTLNDGKTVLKNDRWQIDNRGVGGLFQDAVMWAACEITNANGEGSLVYDRGRGSATGTVRLETQSAGTATKRGTFFGLFPPQTERINEAIFGKASVRIDAQDFAEKFEASSGTPSNQAPQKYAAFVKQELSVALRKDPGGVLVDLRWCTSGNVHANHQVLLIGFDGDQPIFFNPQGAQQGVTSYDNPPRTVQYKNGKNVSIEAMSLELFAGRLNNIMVESSDRADFGAKPLPNYFADGQKFEADFAIEPGVYILQVPGRKFEQDQTVTTKHNHPVIADHGLIILSLETMASQQTAATPPADFGAIPVRHLDDDEQVVASDQKDNWRKEARGTEDELRRRLRPFGGWVSGSAA